MALPAISIPMRGGVSHETSKRTLVSGSDAFAHLGSSCQCQQSQPMRQPVTR